MVFSHHITSNHNIIVFVEIILWHKDLILLNQLKNNMSNNNSILLQHLFCFSGFQISSLVGSEKIN